jgi:Transglycosylase SLT domain
MANKRLVALVLIGAALILPGQTSAGTPKKTGLEARKACPIDEPFRVGSSQAIGRYSTLSACVDNILLAPAKDPEVRPTLRIAPQIQETEGPSASDTAEKLSRPGINATDIKGLEAENQILSLRPTTYTTPFDQTIQNVARRHRVDPLLLHAVIKQESGYRQAVRSHAGAVGLMQIMPGTGASLGVATPDLVVPESNVDAGARLLKKLYYKYNGNFQLVLAAYNAGEGAVQKYGNRIPPFSETQNYVKRVLAHYDRLVADAIGLGASR